MPAFPVDTPSTDRAKQILDAAERCFVRSGFHRSTMQDVAAEAGMSPGNLYRYFASKDAMAAGLAERDRAEIARDFAVLDDTQDFAKDFLSLGRKHLIEEPREHAILCLEIWAEATRNPAFATMSRAFECDVIDRMASAFRAAQARGAIAADIDAHSVAVAITTFANGLFVRRAVSPDFNPERELATLDALVGAMLSGALKLPPLTDETS